MSSMSSCDRFRHWIYIGTSKPAPTASLTASSVKVSVDRRTVSVDRNCSLEYNFSTASVNFNRPVLSQYLSVFGEPYTVGKLFKSTFICHWFHLIWSYLQKVMMKTLQCCQTAKLIFIFQFEKLFCNDSSTQIMQITYC